MPDITKCDNPSCPLKENCYRWTSLSKDGTHQWVQRFEYKVRNFNDGLEVSTCDHQILNQ